MAKSNKKSSKKSRKNPTCKWAETTAVVGGLKVKYRKPVGLTAAGQKKVRRKKDQGKGKK